MTAAELLKRLRAEMPPDVLEALGQGLSMSEGALMHLGQAFSYAADDYEGTGKLAEIKMRVALWECAQNEELLERLEAATEPPWADVFAAVMAVGATV